MVFGDVSDESWYVENHLASVLFLACLSVNLDLDFDVVGVRNGALMDIIRYRSELVSTLRQAPIGSVLPAGLLKDAIAEVDADEVASYVTVDVLGTDVFATHSDDYAELDLMDDILVLSTLKGKRRSWHYEGSHRLIEPHWLSWRFSSLIVFTNTDDLALVLRREIALV